MRKNVSGQHVAFQMVSSTDGSAVTTGTPTVYYTVDGGTQGTQGAGVGVTHEGNGQWSYAAAQAETNGNHVVFTMVLSGAVSQAVNVYPVGYDETATYMPSNVIQAAGTAWGSGAITAASLATDAVSEIVAAVFVSSMADHEGTAPKYSLCTAIQSNLRFTVTGETNSVKKTDGTELYSFTDTQRATKKNIVSRA